MSILNSPYTDALVASAFTFLSKFNCTFHFLKLFSKFINPKVPCLIPTTLFLQEEGAQLMQQFLSALAKSY
jgi:hypothetical protein